MRRAKPQTAPKTAGQNAELPPRSQPDVTGLVESTFAPRPTPPTVLELYGPMDFGSPSGRLRASVEAGRKESRLELLAWSSPEVQGTELEVRSDAQQKRDSRRKSAHAGDDTTTGLERGARR